jgi:hypothetical protein
MAAQAEQEAIDSFVRSDTDGALSQWASRITAERYRLEATLLENDGYTEAPALFYNGVLASTHQGHGQYGAYWVLNDETEAAFGKRFFSPSNARNWLDRDRAKGFTYGTIRVKGLTDVAGDLATARAFIRPNYEALKAGEFTIIGTDNYAGYTNI